MELSPGTFVTDNLRLVELLGEGGMGCVWVADHLTLRTKVAVKFIAAELIAQSPELVPRFTREATAAAQIKSPHVVQTFDHGVMTDGSPYIVMELLEGEDLGQKLDREKKMPLAHVEIVISQVAKALNKAHAAGIIHRDIKPDNIFLVSHDDDEEPFVKVLDFGVAKHTAAQSHSIVTATGAMVGTPAYMSPEQILTGKSVDVRSDIWSMGVVAYHALIGDIPFEGETLGALCVSISKAAVTPPSAVDPSIPASVDAWMARALARQPEDRFQSAKELAESFRAAIRGEPVALPPSLQVDDVSTASTEPPPQQAQAAAYEPMLTGDLKIPRRSPATLIAAAIAGLLALLSVVAYFAFGDSPKAPSSDPAATSSAKQTATSTGQATATDSAAAATSSVVAAPTGSAQSATASATKLETGTTPTFTNRPRTTKRPPVAAASNRPAPPRPTSTTKDRGF